MKPWLKLALDAGPLGVFFIANWQFGIFHATAALMAATVVSVAVTYWLERRLPTMPLVVAVMVLIFGGLTLYLDDDLFIKLKPTIVNLLFGATLAVGLVLKRNYLKVLFREAFTLDDEGWRKLAWRWAGFFFVLAALNEFVWRSFETDTWVDFKVFGIMPLTILFSLTQVPLILKHTVEESPAQTADHSVEAEGD